MRRRTSGGCLRRWSLRGGAQRRTKSAWTSKQVRRYDAWYAHITLAMAAAAFLAATRAHEHAKDTANGDTGDAAKGATLPRQTRSRRQWRSGSRRRHFVARIPLVAACLQCEQLGVPAGGRHQFDVASLFRDLPLVEYHEQIRVAYRSQPV
jgi:hypothetical protein